MLLVLFYLLIPHQDSLNFWYFNKQSDFFYSEIEGTQTKLYQWASLSKPVTFYIARANFGTSNTSNCLKKELPISALLNHKTNLPEGTANIFNGKLILKTLSNVMNIINTENITYSNINYIIIGNEISCKNKKPFIYIRNEHWKKWTKDITYQEYSADYPFDDISTPSGNLVTTPKSLILFGNEFLNCLNTKQCMFDNFPNTKCIVNTYCLGFFYQNYNENTIYQHRGELPNLSTLFLLIPETSEILLVHSRGPSKNSGQSLITKEIIDDIIYKSRILSLYSKEK